MLNLEEEEEEEEEGEEEEEETCLLTCWQNSPTENYRTVK